MNLNVNLTVENLSPVKNGIIIDSDASSKIQNNIIHVKKIIFVILLNAVAKMLNIYENWRIMNFKKVPTKNCTCYYFNDMIDFQDFDFDNI